MENSNVSKKRKVSDEELENVTGGTCYAKGKGVVDPYTGRQRRYAKVSPLNFCPLPINKGIMCMDCGNSFRIGASWYCRHRWWEDGGGHEATQ